MVHVPAVPLLAKGMGKAAEDGPSGSVTITPITDSDEAPGFGLVQGWPL